MTLQASRPFIFLGLFIILFILERLKPSYQHKYGLRYFSNFTLLALGILILKIAFPAGLAVLTDKVPSLPWHLNQLPFYADLILTLLLFDLAIYWQHRFSHKWNWFWQIHAIHHRDLTLDVSSGVRFHPLEIMISGFYKSVLILLLGPRLENYLLYEVALSCLALFNHSNLAIPEKLEHLLRKVIVTPEMHYPHHSPDKRLTNTNFGNLFSFWDRIFKTYSDEKNRTFGLDDYTEEKPLKLFTAPFEYDYFKKD